MLMGIRGSDGANLDRTVESMSMPKRPIIEPEKAADARGVRTATGSRCTRTKAGRVWPAPPSAPKPS